MHSTFVYSIAEACAVAGIRRTTLYKSISAGELRAIRIRGRTLILARDLHRWLEGMPPVQPDRIDPPTKRSDPSAIGGPTEKD
jgi:excisionase family DNA binding protein